jgi:hypothetical protein
MTQRQTPPASVTGSGIRRTAAPISRNFFHDPRAESSAAECRGSASSHAASQTAAGLSNTDAFEAATPGTPRRAI